MQLWAYRHVPEGTNATVSILERRRLIDWARINGHEIVEHFVDADPGHPTEAFDRMIRQTRTGATDVEAILILSTKHLARRQEATRRKLSRALDQLRLPVIVIVDSERSPGTSKTRN